MVSSSIWNLKDSNCQYTWQSIRYFPRYKTQRIRLCLGSEIRPVHPVGTVTLQQWSNRQMLWFWYPNSTTSTNPSSVDRDFNIQLTANTNEWKIRIVYLKNSSRTVLIVIIISAQCFSQFIHYGSSSLQIKSSRSYIIQLNQLYSEYGIQIMNYTIHTRATSNSQLTNNSGKIYVTVFQKIIVIHATSTVSVHSFYVGSSK